jgi:hypothetical protein
MCTNDSACGDLSVASALRVMDAALDYMNGTGGQEIEAAGLGDVLESLGVLSAKFAAAQASILARFDAVRGHDSDGYGSAAAWLAARCRTTRKGAGTEVRRMRVLRQHPVIAEALGRGELSQPWAAEIAGWTSKLPPAMPSPSP